MRIVIINIAIFSFLILLSEISIRLLNISQLQGVDKNLFKFEDNIVLNRPNSEAKIFGNKAFIDEYGFRVPEKNHEYKYNKSLLILGDSVSFGVGVDENKTISGILREKLKTNIYNASVAGHNIIDYSILIEKYHKKFDDISSVLIFICLNDAHFSQGIVKKHKLNEDENKYIFDINILEKINVFLRNKSALFVLVKSKFTKSDERHFRLLNDYYSDSVVLKKYKETVSKINKFSNSKNLKVEFVILPYSYQIKNNCDKDLLNPQYKINKIFSDLSIKFYDLTNIFCEDNENNLFLNYDPVHLSIKGHKSVANFLENNIF